MTQEDKKLLVKDLCARLPYKPKFGIGSSKLCNYDLVEININKRKVLYGHGLYTDLEKIKPYLRPISSMTQGEWEEMTALIYPHGRVNRNPDNKNELLLWLSVEGNEMPIILMEYVFSWLNAHHFDYRGLIEKGLALEAPKEMYKNDTRR